MLSFTHQNNKFMLEGKTLTIVTKGPSGAISHSQSFELPDEIVGDMTHTFYDYITKTIMKPIPDYGDHVDIETFKEWCRSGYVIDSDGTGYYATDKKISGYPVRCNDIRNGLIDNRFTHVVWFSK